MKADACDNVIRDANENVCSWIAAVIGELAIVSLEPPTSALLAKPPSPAEVKAYLLGFAPAASSRDQQSAPMQFQNRYLVTVWGTRAAEEHQILSRLILRAMNEREAELDLTPPSFELWRSLGLPPRPSFMLTVPARVERQIERAPLVRDVIVRSLPRVALSGRVVGDGDVPLAGAVVNNTTIDVTTRTDHDGQFRFPTAPGGDTIQTLTIHARGRSKAFSVKPTQGRGEPMVFRFAIKEG